MATTSTSLPVHDLSHLRAAVIRSTTYEEYATYDIQITCQDLSWIVTRRFSEFQELHDALAAHCTSLPTLPEKTFLRSLEPDFIEKRRVRLNVYIQSLVTLPYSRNSRHLMAFLEIQKHFRPDTSSFPRIYQTIVDRNFGTNDVVYSAEDGFLLAACEDVAMLSKIETKLGYLGSFFASLTSSSSQSTSTEHLQADPQTLALPKVESIVDPGDSDTLISGLVTCWIRDPTQDAWTHISTVCFNSPAAHIVWDRRRRRAYVGLENGHLVVLAASEELKQLTPISELALHTDRYAGLIYVEQHDALLAASRDRRVSVYNLSENKLIGRSLVNDPKFASLALDPNSGLVYVGGFDSALYVYEVNFGTGVLTPRSFTAQSAALPVSLVRGINNLHRGCIRALSIDTMNTATGSRTLLMTGSFDYSSLVIELPSTISQLSRQPTILTTFQGGVPSNIKAAALCVAANVAVTGHDDGSVMVWDLTTGRPLYHSQAHSNSVVYLKYLQSSNTIISAGRDGKIHFWLLSARLPSQHRQAAASSASASASASAAPSATSSLQAIIPTITDHEEHKSPTVGVQAERSIPNASPIVARPHPATMSTSSSSLPVAPSAFSEVDDGLVDLKLNDDEFADLGMKFVEE